MGKNQLKTKDLKKANIVLSELTSLALTILSKSFKYQSKEEKITILQAVYANPSEYLEDENWSVLANKLNGRVDLLPIEEIELKKEIGDYAIFGKEFIQKEAIQQMNVAMQLPISKKGALMPDAHSGYGLPIGGVLATENAVIPYGVGVDIGCRMCMTLYDLPDNYIERYHHQLKEGLKEHTAFGMGKEVINPFDDEILEHKAFYEIPIVKRMHKKAQMQLGSSGSGNHFVEFGYVDIQQKNNSMNLPLGRYVAILSHSGSRGLGATIANHYTQIAMQKCQLPRPAKQLAWLDLDSEEGMEYWISMNLAGDYAQACHDHIHYRLGKVLGKKPVGKIENHHNFAWKEKQPTGEELIVHRKGATPAAKGEMGIIPGSMATPGFIVEGKGERSSLSSASHGAGRHLSRSKAAETMTRSKMLKILDKERITLIGGGVDEAPIAYKNIHDVIEAQTELINIVGTFYPKIVRMDNR